MSSQASAPEFTDGRPVLWRLPTVKQATGLGRTSIYERMKAGTFPQSIGLGGSMVAWSSTQILDWIDEQIEASRQARGVTKQGRAKWRVLKTKTGPPPS